MGKREEEQVLRTYKDSVFRTVFHDKEKALDLYNALTGSSFGPETKLEFTTLDEVLFKTRKNDLSFLLADIFIFMVEHQAFICGNLAIRDLLYFAETIQRLYSNKDFYKSTEIKLPRPKFIVLYNGTEPLPDYVQINLSDCFLGEGEIDLQLTVNVYNINEGRNPEIMVRCKALHDYSRFVAMVREAAKKGPLTEVSMQKVLQQCIEEDIMADVLKKHGTEVVNMLYMELTQDEAMELSREDGYEVGHREGMQQGMEEGILKTAKNMKAEGCTLELIANCTGLPIEQIEKL